VKRKILGELTLYEETFRIRNKKTLQNAPRDEAKLRELLKFKEKENEQATHIEDTQRLVTEIEMLKFVLCLVSRDNGR
jgi:hypothetical protein